MNSVVSTIDPISSTWTYFEDEWRPGNIAIMGPRTHGAWMGSTVFDGARAYHGMAPDLDLHMARVNESARLFLLEPRVSTEEWLGLVFSGGVKFDPASTRWCLCLYEAPMPGDRPLAITLSPFRRPTIECAPVDAKAGCLYPNNARALIEAAERGFDNCLLTDMLGNIAELANSNVFLVKDGVVFTPAPNGTFLDGITRRRVIGLLRGEGLEVVEASLRYHDFITADEIFSTGNYAKISAITRIDQRHLVPGPVFRKASALYREFARDTSTY
jgi:branched-chain amino acid aminotransferase